MENWVGFTAAALTTLAYLPQVIRVILTRKTEDISRNMYILLETGIILWLIYGIIKNELPIIIANSITIFFTTIILYFKLTEKQK